MHRERASAFLRVQNERASLRTAGSAGSAGSAGTAGVNLTREFEPLRTDLPSRTFG